MHKTQSRLGNMSRSSTANNKDSLAIPLTSAMAWQISSCISLCVLAPLHAPGDHIKYCCLNTQGIVSVVCEEGMALTFMIQDTHEEVCTVSLTQDI